MSAGRPSYTAALPGSALPLTGFLVSRVRIQMQSGLSGVECLFYSSTIA